MCSFFVRGAANLALRWFIWLRPKCQKGNSSRPERPPYITGNPFKHFQSEMEQYCKYWHGYFVITDKVSHKSTKSGWWQISLLLNDTNAVIYNKIVVMLCKRGIYRSQSQMKSLWKLYQVGFYSASLESESRVLAVDKYARCNIQGGVQLLTAGR